MGTYQGKLPNPKTHWTNEDVIKGILKFAKEIADDNSYKYRKWNENNKYTKQCPLHYPESNKYATKGWNCRGYVAASYYHGGGVHSVKCSCSGMGLLGKRFNECTLANWKKDNGPDWIKIENNGKNLKKSQLQNGDVLIYFNSDNSIKHWALMYDVKNSKTADATSSNGIKIRKPSSYGKMAFRYTGHGANYREYFKKGDTGETIKLWQEFLNWYVGTDACEINGVYDSVTYKYTIQFQTEVFNKDEADGLVGVRTIEKAKCYDKQSPTPIEPQPYCGTLPKSLKVVKTRQEVIDDTITWLKWIASNNDFHYGYGQAAHHNGCYFCGTQPAVKKKAGIKKYETTYCCNPLIGAGWAHGGQDKKAISLCKAGKSWDFHKKKGQGYYYGSDRFKNIAVKKESDMKPGDVMCNDHHVAIYIGNDKMIEASGNDQNKPGSTAWNNSIRVRKLSTKYSGKWNKEFKRYHRYIGSVNRNIDIEFGEYSDRVKQIQKFLNWYGNYGLKEDGKFYDNTKTALKKFQKAEKLSATAKVDKATLAKMKTVKK